MERSGDPAEQDRSRVVGRAELTDDGPDRVLLGAFQLDELALGHFCHRPVGLPVELLLEALERLSAFFSSPSG